MFPLKYKAQYSPYFQHVSDEILVCDTFYPILELSLDVVWLTLISTVNYRWRAKPIVNKIFYYGWLCWGELASNLVFGKESKLFKFISCISLFKNFSTLIGVKRSTVTGSYILFNIVVIAYPPFAIIKNSGISQLWNFWWGTIISPLFLDVLILIWFLYSWFRFVFYKIIIEYWHKALLDILCQSLN